MCTVKVYGLLPTIQFQKAKHCAEDLYKKNKNRFKEPAIYGMLEFEWSIWLANKKAEIKNELWACNDPVLVFADDELIGNMEVFLQWAFFGFNYEDFRNETLYETLRKEDYAAYLSNSKCDFVFMEFNHGGEYLGRLIIQLFSNILPKSCENFRQLCTGEKGRSDESLHNLHYKNTIITRIVPNGWIQGGDIVAGKGNASESVYGGLFEDETYQIRHDKRGIVGLANTGRHTNGSQFYVTLQPAPWMDKKFVAIGQVVEGYETLAKLEAISTQNQRPLKECKIVACGSFNFDF